mmetsp:Transcript_26960/g.39877  ORF Transcript_26960/g.39877 Transcript_26960/m.39877 type:complete len:366 (+) Transcript_26960:172-1269(+)
MACEPCHLAKVKCDKKSPCSRCTRLGLECVPHISLQGKGIKRRKKGTNSKLVVENAFIRNTSQISTSGPLHFGLNHLLRQWIFLSFARRSFRLLEVAARLSNKLGMHMDQIISGKNLPDAWVSDMTNPEMSLGSSISSPSEAQEVGGPALETWEIPLDVWKAMYCTAQGGCKSESAQGGCKSECVNVENLDKRWIFVRGNKEGKTRFFVSEAFSQDITPVSVIQKTWEENQQEILSLWFKGSHHENNAKGRPLLFYLLNQYHSPDSHPSPVRSSREEKIKLANGDEVLAHVITYYRIVDLDDSFLVMEVLLPRRDTQSIEPLPLDQADLVLSPDKDKSFLDDMPDFGVLGEGAENWLGDLLDSLS